MRRRKALQREKPLNRRKRRPPLPKDERRRALRVTADEWEVLRKAVLGRAGSRCERCGTDLRKLKWWECHHRKLKSQGGGDWIDNLLALCPTCHNGHQESAHRRITLARTNGWIVPSWADHETVPVLLHDGRRVLLDRRGGYVELPAAPAEAA
jgi:hypothetical protein